MGFISWTKRNGKAIKCDIACSNAEKSALLHVRSNQRSQLVKASQEQKLGNIPRRTWLKGLFRFVEWEAVDDMKTGRA